MRSIAVILALSCPCAAISQTLEAESFRKYKEQAVAHPRDSLAHFRLGEYYAAQKNYQSSASEFNAALIGDLEPTWTLVWSRINLGKLFDATGQCFRALNEFNLALRTADNAFSAQTEIDEYLNAKIIHPFATLPDQADDGRSQGAAVEKNVRVPVLLQKTKPVYTEAALRAELEGTVHLKAVIDEKGSVSQVQVIRPLGLDLDQKAIETVKLWRFAPALAGGRAVPQEVDLSVDFLLPSKQSRWHLVGVAFEPPKGASEPSVAHAEFPAGAGVQRDAIDDAGVIGAMGRFAAVRLRLEIDESGLPVHIEVDRASEEFWGTQAVAILRKWHFIPGQLNGRPVAVRGRMDFIWGARTLTTSPLENVLNALNGPVPEVASDEGCRTPQSSRQ